MSAAVAAAALRWGDERKANGFERSCKALNQRLSELRQHGGKAMQEYFRQHLEGHLRYCGVSGNYQRLEDYVHYASRILFKWQLGLAP